MGEKAFALCDSSFRSGVYLSSKIRNNTLGILCAPWENERGEHKLIFFKKKYGWLEGGLIIMTVHRNHMHTYERGNRIQYLRKEWGLSQLCFRI